VSPPARMTRDCVRNGTTSLSAAFGLASSSWMNLAGRWFAELTNRTAPLSAPRRHRAGDRHPHVDQRVELEPGAVRVGQDRR